MCPMFKTRQVEPYPAAITAERLALWQGVVRVWDSPMSAIEGAKVIDLITAPVKAMVLEEHLDIYGSLPERARIRYGDEKEGWVVYVMIERGGGEGAVAPASQGPGG